MRLIIGGYAQGKLGYVCRDNKDVRFEIFDGVLPTKKVLLEVKEQGKIPVVNRFHEFVKNSLSEGNNPEDEWQSIMEYIQAGIIISDEIGNGIVPMDDFEREYRERTGRMLVKIAEQADEVVRVVCGIGQKIK